MPSATLLPTRCIGDLVTEAARFIDEARQRFHPIKSFVLFSGGNDSLVLLDLARRYGWAPDGVVHVNTGTGVPETTEFVRETCREWGLELHELQPPASYEEVFINQGIINGLPGPGMHRVAYSRLKERPLRAFVKEQKSKHSDKVLLLTGIRADESRRRMGYTSSVIDKQGAKVWVNPIYLWTDDEMTSYKALFGLPRNPVADHLHISGECLCGAFARPNELEEIAFFYPAVAARIRAWQEEARKRGLTYWRWGARRQGKGRDDGGKLCGTCVVRQATFFGDEQ